jgi:shikimate kinase
MAIAAQNIALVGFRATGKSTIGRILAEKLGYTFVDMDEELVARFGTDIHNWVQEHGWEAFRDAEAQLLAELAGHIRQIVATGGGVVIREDNREQLKTNFFTIWLQTSEENIQARLSQDPKTRSQRPALTELSLREEITAILQQRTPWYRETADLILATDAQDPAELVKSILTGMDTTDRMEDE